MDCMRTNSSKLLISTQMGAIYMNIKKLNENTVLDYSRNTPFISFPALSRYDFIIHGFSSRLGGVSKGEFSSMNLGFNRGDDEKNVFENYRLICESMGINEKDLVFTDQVHKANIRKVTQKDKGKGIIYQRDYQEIDAHITNESNVPLLVFSADCVPIYLLDTRKKVIGLAHSGWRGTVLKIGKLTVESMIKEFNTDPRDVMAVIGPSIGPSCYEVSKDVAYEFMRVYTEKEKADFILKKLEDKYYIDLWKANRYALLAAGLNNKNIVISGLCTMCNQDICFSHRAMGMKRGSMAAFMQLNTDFL